MKTFITILLLSLVFISCDNNTPKTFDNSEELTTIQLQNLSKDTIIVSEFDKYIYVFNEDNLVVNRYLIQTKHGRQVSIGTILLLIFLFVLITSVILFTE